MASKQSKIFSVLGTIAMLSAVVGLFQNCAEDLNPEAYTKKSGSFDLPSTVDDTPYTSVGMGPTITITSSDVAGPNLPFKSDASFQFVVADNGSGVASITCSLDGGAFTPCSTNSSATYAGLAAGNHSFRIRALDVAQRESVIERTWTVGTFDLNNLSTVTCSVGIREYYTNVLGNASYKKGMDFSALLNGFPQYSVGKFVGQVIGRDRLRLTSGGCRPADVPIFSGCTVSLGHSDGAAVVSPTSSTTVALGSSTLIESPDLTLGGNNNNVDGNDKLYVRMNCPAAQPAYQGARDWIKSRCQLCLGHSNNNASPVPSGAENTVACVNIRDANDMTWAPLALLGSDVDDDNRLHLRFVCQ